LHPPVESADSPIQHSDAPIESADATFEPPHAKNRRYDKKTQILAKKR